MWWLWWGIQMEHTHRCQSAHVHLCGGDAFTPLSASEPDESHLTSPHLTPLHLTSPHLTSPHLTSPHLSSIPDTPLSNGLQVRTEDSAPPIMQPYKGAFANSIPFGSAPRREVDSQPISPLARPAVSQTETQSLGFLSVADAAPSSGETFCLRPSSGRMVTQLTRVFLVGGSNPGRVHTAPPPPPTVGRLGFEPPTENFASAALPFNRQLCDSDKLPQCLGGPSERKLLTPPPPAPPPPQKSDIQF